MNKRSLILLPVAMLFLAGCNNDTSSESTSSTTTPTSETTTSTTTEETTSSSEEEKVNYGTLAAPLSIAEFNTEVAKLGLESGKFSTEHFFVKGYVSADPTYYSSSSSYLLKLTDGKDSSAYINASGVKPDTGVESPYKNDTVVVEGLAEKYNNNYSIWYTDSDYPALKSVARGTSTVTTSIENGTVSGLETTYTNGATATFTITPAADYKVGVVNVSTENTALEATDGKYSFVVKGDATVKVTMLKEGEELATVHTVVFNSTNNQDSISSYVNEWNNISDGVTYKITNMNNNKNEWDGYIRAGRKNNTSVASISTTTVFSKAITLASIDIQKTNASLTNSFKMIVASDAAFTTVVEEIDVTNEVGTQTVQITKSTENCYYKFELDLQAHSANNGFVQIGNVTFTEAE